MHIFAVRFLKQTYQIFNGIIEKLDYIQDLGCNAIWINPCFQSPFGDAGYDVEDYYTVAPRYGTNEDLIRCLRKRTAKICIYS